MKWLSLALILLAFTLGCDDADEQDLDIKDIRFSDWHYSEKYGAEVIEVINYDERPRTINITSLCFDEDDNLISSEDSEILTLKPRDDDLVMPVVLIPVCPNGTRSYNLDRKKLD